MKSGKKQQPEVTDNFVLDISESKKNNKSIDLRPEFPDIVASLSTCTFTHGDNFETIVKFDANKPTKMIVKSIRTNNCSRILVVGRVVEEKPCWLMLKHLPNHEYEKAKRSLLKKQTLLAYIDKHWELVLSQLRELEAKLAESASVSSSSKPSYSYISPASNAPPTEIKQDDGDLVEETVNEEVMTEEEKEDDEELVVEEMAIFNEQFIQLNEEQKQAINSRTPIICGMPGTGKSCVAMQIMSDVLGETLENINAEQEPIEQNAVEGMPEIQEIEELKGDPTRIIYVTASEKLKKNMKEMNKNKGIEFKTYLELMQELIPSIKKKTIVGKKEFMEWADKHVGEMKSVIPEEQLAFGWTKPIKNFKDELLDIITRSAQDANLADFLNQECRIMSGLSRDEYRIIGEKKSLFTTSHLDLPDKELSEKLKRDFRDKLYDILDKYRDVLVDKKQVDLAFLDVKEYINLAEHFYQLVIDEAQDFSNLQLATLAKLTKYIIYFLDTQQSLHDNLSKIPYLMQLLRTDKKSELTQSLRCSRGIVDVANVVLDMKYKLTGGVADQHVKSKMVGKPDALEGHITWIDQPTLEQEEQMLAAITSPQCAIITLPEFLEDANRKFPGAHILTVDQAKGLEFETVIAYRIFESKRYFHINELLSKHQGVVKENINRPGSGKAHHEYGPDFSQLFTAITRTKTSLIVYNDLQDQKLMKSLTAGKKLKKYDLALILKTAPAVSKLELKMNQEEERYEYRILKYGEPPIEGFIDWNNLEKEGVVIPVNKEDLLEIIPILLPKITVDPIEAGVKPAEYKSLWEIELVKDQDPQFSHKTRSISKELQRAIQIKQSVVLSDALIVGTEKNWIEVIKADIENVETKLEVTPENVREIYAGAWKLYCQKIGTDVDAFYQLVNPSELLRHLQRKDYDKILSEPKLLAQLTTEHLKSFLVELSQTVDGTAILLDRLKNKPAIFDGMNARDFMQLHKDNKSAAYCLTTGSDRVNLFLALLNQTQIFKNGYVWQDLFIPLMNERSLNRSVFFNLSEHDAGHVILEKLFEPLWTKKCKTENLAYALFTEVNMAGFPFYNLIKSPSGINILTALLAHYPELAQHITAKQLRRVVKDYTQSMDTSLALLSQSSQGLKFLSEVVKLNRNLRSELNSKHDERDILIKIDQLDKTVHMEIKVESVSIKPATPKLQKKDEILKPSNNAIKYLCEYKIAATEESHRTFVTKLLELFAKDRDTCASLFEIIVPTKGKKNIILIDNLLEDEDKKLAIIGILKNSDGAAKFTIEKLRSKLITLTDPPQSPFYYLCLHHPVFLGVLLAGNPELLQQITVDDIMSGTPNFPNCTALHSLCARNDDGTALMVLSKMVENNNVLVKSLRASHLLLRVPEEVILHGNSSPAFLLSTTYSGRKILLNLLNETIAADFTADDLLQQLVNTQRSMLSHLSETRDGHEILIKLFKLNGNLIKQFDGKNLVKYLFTPVSKQSPFRHFVRSNSGIEILTQLILKNPDVAKHITLKNLWAVTEHQTVPPIVYLSTTEKGREFILHLLKGNEALMADVLSGQEGSLISSVRINATFKTMAQVFADANVNVKSSEIKEDSVQQESSTNNKFAEVKPIKTNLNKPKVKLIKSIFDFKVTDDVSRESFKNKLLNLFAADIDTCAGLFENKFINQDKEEITLIKNILEDPEKRHVLVKIMSQNDNIKKFTMEYLRTKINTLYPLPMSPLSYLAKNYDGFLFNILEHNPELAWQITVDDLMQIDPVVSNRTVLYFLCSKMGGSALQILSQLLNENKTLAANITAQHLLLALPDEVNEFAGTSPAYFLSFTKEGREIFLTLLSETVAKGFTAENLLLTPKLKDTSILFNLSETSDGHEILMRLFKLNDRLLSQFNGANLVDYLAKRFSGKSALVNLTKFPSGIDVLKKLIFEHEEASQFITPSKLWATSKEQPIPAIFYLSLSKKGCEFLLELLKRNATLLSVIVNSADLLLKRSITVNNTVKTLADQLNKTPGGLEIIELIKTVQMQNAPEALGNAPNTVTDTPPPSYTSEDKDDLSTTPAKISETPQTMYGNKGGHLVVSDKLETGQDLTFNDQSSSTNTQSDNVVNKKYR